MLFIYLFSGHENKVREVFMNSNFVSIAEPSQCRQHIICMCSEWAGRERTSVPINCLLQDIFYVLNHNWLMQMCLYVADFVRVANQSCMICDRNLK